MIKITSVDVVLVDEGNLRAYINFIIDSTFMVRGAKIIQTSNGLIVAMPNKKRKEETGNPKKDWRDCCHPIDQETRDYVDQVILAAYREKLEE